MARSHTLRLGFFANFKGADSILLECSAPQDVVQLSALLSALQVTAEPVLPIHVFARLAPAHQVRLFATRTVDFHQPGFLWLCSPATVESIRSALKALAGRGSGHQYFELVSSPVQLIVACREYGPEWWLAQG
jgi:hypothetical protein